MTLVPSGVRSLNEWLQLIIALAALALFSCFSTSYASGQIPIREMRKLEFSEANDVPFVRLLIASKVGENRTNAKRIARLGARVVLRDDALDVLGFVVSRSMAIEVFGSIEIEGVDIDIPTNTSHLWQHTEGGRFARYGDAERPRLKDKAGLQLLPYGEFGDVLEDIGAAEALGRGSSYDGRGVTIAQVEALADPLLPELKYAKSVNGLLIDKFLDVIPIPDHQYGLYTEQDEKDPRWIELRRVSKISPISLPDGYINEVEEQLLAGSIMVPAFVCIDLLDDENPTFDCEDGLRFEVLWTNRDKVLWIDNDRDGSFHGETAIGVFSDTQRFGVLGRDNPNTDSRETIAVAIQYDTITDMPVVELAASPHATSVAAALAANTFAGGRTVGTAPGAQIISVSSGSSAFSFARAMITAFQDDRVDIVLIEGRSPITYDHSPRFGRPALTVLLNRLADKWQKPTVVTAGNGVGLSSVSSISEPENVLSISNYASVDTTNRLLGIEIANDGLAVGGAEGPSWSGNIKPDVLSPSYIVLPVSPTKTARLYATPKGAHILPKGYFVTSGSSIAAPTAAGGLARILSAAKQNSIELPANCLIIAIRRTARHLPHIQAYKQGYGILDVDHTWRNVRRSPKCLETKIQIHHTDSRIYHSSEAPEWLDRQASIVGQRRQFTLRRLAGPKAPQRVRLKWAGDATFIPEAPAELYLPLNEDVSFEIGIVSEQTSAHSAILVLEDDEGRLLAASLVNHIQALEFSQDGANRISKLVDVPYGQDKSLFVSVPEDARALVVETIGAGTDRMLLFSPDRKLAGLYYGDRTNNEATRKIVVGWPQQGIWEIVLENGYALEPRTGVGDIDSVKIVSWIIRGWKTSQYTQDASESEAASYNRQRVFVDQEMRRSIKIGMRPEVVDTFEVKDDGQSILLKLDGKSQETPFELSLFRCEKEGCYLWRRRGFSSPKKHLWVLDAKPGKWMSVITAPLSKISRSDVDYGRYVLTSDRSAWHSGRSAIELVYREDLAETYFPIQPYASRVSPGALRDLVIKQPVLLGVNEAHVD